MDVLLALLFTFGSVIAMAVAWGFLFYFLGTLLPYYRHNGVFNNRWELKVFSLGFGVFASIATFAIVVLSLNHPV